MEQLDRCADQGRCGGRFGDWARELKRVSGLKTDAGNPRLDLTAFGFYHPLMPLIPERDIVRQIVLHRALTPRAFGAEASTLLFPPETAFHPRMIPALNQAGIRAVMYDSIHRNRTCRDYPYAGLPEGMLPPNPADQVNPPVSDWLRLHNVWTGSEIAPSLLRPEYLVYTDPDGEEHKVIGVPAERYIGNEDARGGFGALQYPDVLGQVYDQLQRTGGFDPKHPPFFLLHSDGDNHGGGAESYYRHNTGAMIAWLQQDPRFELTTVADYLDRFPPDPASAVHLEPGSWAGADNGDPQFMKWFSRYREPYSPDLNSWAVLTALQNAVHTLEDAHPDSPLLEELVRLLLTAEASDYWYWTGQTVWDQQVTNAANRAWSIAGSEFGRLANSRFENTGPTIFPPWVTPENRAASNGDRAAWKMPRAKAGCTASSTTCPGWSGCACTCAATPASRRWSCTTRAITPVRPVPRSRRATTPSTCRRGWATAAISSRRWTTATTAAAAPWSASSWPEVAWVRRRRLGSPMPPEPVGWVSVLRPVDVPRNDSKITETHGV